MTELRELGSQSWVSTSTSGFALLAARSFQSHNYSYHANSVLCRLKESLYVMVAFGSLSDCFLFIKLVPGVFPVHKVSSRCQETGDTLQCFPVPVPMTRCSGATGEQIPAVWRVPPSEEEHLCSHSTRWIWMKGAVKPQWGSVKRKDSHVQTHCGPASRHSCFFPINLGCKQDRYYAHLCVLVTAGSRGCCIEQSYSEIKKPREIMVLFSIRSHDFFPGRKYRRESDFSVWRDKLF